jgi:hypothetical protein
MPYAVALSPTETLPVSANMSVKLNTAPTYSAVVVVRDVDVAAAAVQFELRRQHRADAGTERVTVVVLRVKPSALPPRPRRTQRQR